jgi:hypothetical protein
MTNSVLIISLIIITPIFIYFVIRWKVFILNKAIFKSLILFILSVFVFSVIYTISYKKNNSCFYYADFLKNQKSVELKQQKNEIQLQAKKKENEIDIYKVIYEFIEENNKNWKPQQTGLYVSMIEFHIDDIKLQIRFENMLSPSKSSNHLGQRFYFNLIKNGLVYEERVYSRPLPDSIYKYEAINNSTYVNLLNDFFLPISSQDYKIIFDDFIAELLNQLDEFKKNNIIEKAPEETFNFGDFLYYSIMNQTTIGVTDIYPNTNFIRILISIQALISVFITVFLINNTFLRNKNTNP